MSIHGLNKLTLLDYPGKVAATIFTGGCNFRCPFCHNRDLVLDPTSQPVLEQEEILDFLKKRQGILDGVCITGGEPTLYGQLEPFIEKIKVLGYMVKLDTNGTRPAVVKQLVQKGLVDMVAMDIKSCLSRYAQVAGVADLELTAIQETAAFLMEGHIPYEFRTTVVKELHQKEDFEQIGQWLKGCQAYYLQAYKDTDTVIQRGFTTNTRQELEEYRQILLKWLPVVEIRGMD